MSWISTSLDMDVLDIKALPRVKAGGLAQAWLHWLGEAVSRVRSHISPGPYRSFRELSLARSVDLATWCPPTFVGNSGIECSNGHRGFALLFFGLRIIAAVSARTIVILRESGVSSTPRLHGLLRLLRITGSPAGACHRARRRRDPVAG